MIRKCTESDFETIFEIINDAAMAYKGIIPDDRWHEPYMPKAEVRQQIEDGVIFWGFQQDRKLLGVMGIQGKRRCGSHPPRLCAPKVPQAGHR